MPPPRPGARAGRQAREGKVDLAKVDVDANQRLAQAFQVQGIPAVKAFKDGEMVSEFTGAIPPPQIERFFDDARPVRGRAAGRGRARVGRRGRAAGRARGGPAQLDSGRGRSGRLLLERGDVDEALEVLEPHERDFTAAGLAARARLSRNGGGLSDAFEAWDRDDRAAALEALQAAFAAAPEEEREDIRKVMVAIFTELGPDDPLAREHRRRLSAAMY